MGNSGRELAFADIESQVAAMVSEMVQVSAGIQPVGAIAAGQTKQVDVFLIPPFPDTSYTAAPVVIGDSSVIGTINYVSHAVIQPNLVRVAVKNNALITLNSGSVLVTAVKG